MRKLHKKDIRDIFALTPMQESMLLQYLMEPETDYFEQLRLTLKGTVVPEFFEQAWKYVIRTNEMLRTLFRWEESPDAVQVVLKDYPFHWQFHDLSHLDSFSRSSGLEALLKRDREEIFDLHEVPFRVKLFKTTAEEYEMIISNHHIIYDGWSNGIILGDFFNAYRAISRGESPAVPARTPFKDFVRWYYQQDAGRQQNFWQEYLPGFRTKTRLPSSPQPRFGTKTIEVYRTTLVQEQWEKLQNAAACCKVTLACLFYSAWGMVLHRYCDCDDVVFGTAVSGRNVPLKGSEDMVGVFINTVPLRVRRLPAESRRDFLTTLNRQLQQREEFQHSWLGDIKTFLHWKPHEDLFDSMVIIENYPLERAMQRDNNGNNPDTLTVTGFSAFDVKTSYPLTVVIKLFDTVAINLNFLGEAFDTGVVKNMLHDFIALLEDLSSCADHAGQDGSPREKNNEKTTPWGAVQLKDESKINNELKKHDDFDPEIPEEEISVDFVL